VTASRRVVIGCHTHQDMIHMAVITDSGEPLADAEFPTSSAGYGEAVTWARGFGTIAIAGVEGTSRYGAGLTQFLEAEQIGVTGVSRPDAYAAAHAALAGELRWGQIQNQPVLIQDPDSPGFNPPIPPGVEPRMLPTKPPSKVKTEETEWS
jgi:hypothetical protein